MKNRLINFLISNNIWILLSTIILISFKWVLTFHEFYGSLVYLNWFKWVLFFKLMGALILVFTPLLLFSLFRNILYTKLSKQVYYALWTLVCLGYTIALFFTDILLIIIPVRMESEMLGIIGLVLVLVDIISSPMNRNNFKWTLNKWRDKVSLEWIILSIYVLVSLFLSIGGKMEYPETSWFVVWLQHFSLLMVYYAFYWINHYYLVDIIYRRKGLIYYLFGFLSLVIVFYIPVILILYYMPSLNYLLSYKTGDKWVGENAPFVFWAIDEMVPTYLMLLSIPLTILIQWFKQSNRISNLQKQKSETELNLLKQQINPHFFFNTLNNVYSMSLTKDQKTPEAILQLSELMRYVIYKGQEDTVSISEEINYIEDFLRLQKLRQYADLDIKFEKQIDNKDFQVTPLLFIILVENAFKHGIDNSDGESYLYLRLVQREGDLEFSCLNSVKEPSDVSESGVGLDNLKRRLELIYPNQHVLTHEPIDEGFKATISLQLVN